MPAPGQRDRYGLQLPSAPSHSNKTSYRKLAVGTLEVHRSFYVVTKIDGRWAIQLRSSFVPNRQL